jgi:hypothetical protein
MRNVLPAHLIVHSIRLVESNMSPSGAGQGWPDCAHPADTGVWRSPRRQVESLVMHSRLLCDSQASDLVTVSYDRLKFTWRQHFWTIPTLTRQTYGKPLRSSIYRRRNSGEELKATSKRQHLAPLISMSDRYLVLSSTWLATWFKRTRYRQGVIDRHQGQREYRISTRSDNTFVPSIGHQSYYQEAVWFFTLAGGLDHRLEFCICSWNRNTV